MYEYKTYFIMNPIGLSLLSMSLIITGITALRCHLCSGVGSDRHCERHPFFGQTGIRKPTNCASKFCLAAKVIDSDTGDVKSFARICDNINRGNKCFRDSKLLTCYQSCSTDFCNNGNPDPSSLVTIDYSSAKHTKNSSSQTNSSYSSDLTQERISTRYNTFLQLTDDDDDYNDDNGDDNYADSDDGLKRDTIQNNNTYLKINEEFRKELQDTTLLSNSPIDLLKPQAYLKNVELYMGNNSLKYPQTSKNVSDYLTNNSSFIPADVTQITYFTTLGSDNNLSENNSMKRFQDILSDNVTLNSRYNTSNKNSMNSSISNNSSTSSGSNNSSSSNNSSQGSYSNDTVTQKDTMTEFNVSSVTVNQTSEKLHLNSSLSNMDVEKWMEFVISSREQQNGRDAAPGFNLNINNSASIRNVLQPLLSGNETEQNNSKTNVFIKSSKLKVETSPNQQELVMADASFLFFDSNDIGNGNEKSQKKMDSGHKNELRKMDEIHENNEILQRKNVSIKYKSNIIGNHSNFKNGMEPLLSKTKYVSVSVFTILVSILNF